MEGLIFMKGVISTKLFPNRLQRIALVLINDLIKNDKEIYVDYPTYVRKSYGSDQNLINSLHKIFKEKTKDISG